MTMTDSKTWKAQVRTRAIERRTGMDPESKRQMDAAINQQLEAALLEVLSNCVIGFCWPFKNEFDQRFLMRKLRERGAHTALPIVVKKAHPMIFRIWTPGVPMVRGVFDIPVPADTPEVVPDVVFPPLNAFDDAAFRLGYGGGFFDRTLASFEPRPLAVGIGYEEQRVATIHPTEYDLPMDLIVTEANIYRRVDGHTVPISTGECASAVGELLRRRGLPRPQSNLEC